MERNQTEILELRSIIFKMKNKKFTKPLNRISAIAEERVSWRQNNSNHPNWGTEEKRLKNEHSPSDLWDHNKKSNICVFSASGWGQNSWSLNSTGHLYLHLCSEAPEVHAAMDPVGQCRGVCEVLTHIISKSLLTSKCCESMQHICILIL